MKNLQFEAKLIRLHQVFASMEYEYMFVGGSIVSFLVTDTAIEDWRETKDIDVVIEVATRVKYDLFTTHLRSLGFTPDTREGAPICRYLLNGLIVDIMPLDESVLGFENRFYQAALKHLLWQEIQTHRIPIISAPYFVATKLEAFSTRGRNDFYGSHDMEDIITVLDGRKEWFDEAEASESDLKSFLQTSFASLIQMNDFIWCINGHLQQDSSNEKRAKRLLAKLQQFVEVRK